MFDTLLISFREGLEAFLVVAVAALYLRKTGREHLLGAVRSGLLTAVLGAALLGYALAQLGSMSALWEGSLALVAAVAVVWCVTHMRKMGRHMGQEISSALGQASVLDSHRAWWAVYGFTCFMVGREGVETAAMLASLAGNADLRLMAFGGGVGVGLAALVAWTWVRFGRRVDLAQFFNVTGVFMLIFAVLLVIKAVHEFAEAQVLPGIDNAYWHAVTETYVDGVAAQAASVALVLAPSLWLAFSHWRARRRLATA